MQPPSRISRILLSVIALLAFTWSGLPGTGACRTIAGHGDDHGITESHCVCAHSQEDRETPRSLAEEVAGCGSTCACIPARNSWQGTLTVRSKEERQSVSQPDWPGLRWTGLEREPVRRLQHASPPGHPPAPADPMLQSLRTVILLA